MLLASSTRPLGDSITPGHAGDRAVERVGRQPGRGRRRRSRSSAAASMHGVDVGARHLDVLPRAHLAAQVADRAAQEARAEVEAEHERRLVHRLEERGAVLRARGRRCRPRARARPRAATASVTDTVGLEMPDAARDLGARDRRAGADRLEHRALVEVAQERRCRATCQCARRCRRRTRAARTPGSAAAARARRAPGARRAVDARDEPRRPAGQLGAAEDEGVRAELLDHLDAGVEPLARRAPSPRAARRRSPPCAPFARRPGQLERQPAERGLAVGRRAARGRGSSPASR